MMPSASSQNIAGAMSTSPVLVNCLAALFQNVHGGSFTEPQIQILLLTNAVANGCECGRSAFIRFLAIRQGIPAADVAAIRSGVLPMEPKAAALSQLSRTLIESRGRLTEADRRRVSSGRFRQGRTPRGDRRCRRLDDHQLYRQRHPSSSGAAVWIHMRG